MLVFLRTSEEAVCTTADKCLFKWTVPETKVSSVAVTYEPANLGHKMTITGENFPTLKSKTQLYIDNNLQSIISIKETEAVFQITEMDSITSSNIRLYFADGSPITVTGLDKITVEPSLG